MELLQSMLTDVFICFIYDFSIESTYLVVKKPCETVIKSNMTFEVSVKLHLTFLIHESVNRCDLEYALINATSKYISATRDFLEIKGKVFPDYYASLLPLNIYKTQSTSQCFIFSQTKHTYNNDAYKRSLVSKTLRCPQIILSNDRYPFDEPTQTLTLLPSGPSLAFGDYQIVSKYTVAVCLGDYERISSLTGTTISTLKFVLQIVTLICVSLSMLCLFFAFVTYLAFPILQTLPGRNNICLIFALFLSQGLTQFGLTKTKDRMVCTIIGILIHYFWMATFFCMNVCSFHVFKVFALPFHRHLDAIEEQWYLFRYVCYAYGVPAAIIILYITISLSLSGYIGYGSDSRCFIETPQAIVGTFLAPILLLCVLNVIFFCISAYKIKTSPKVASTTTSRTEFSIYLKLFILTGFTWIAQILESFFPISLFSVVVAILNGSSGIFIFFSYTMNERVRTFYRNSVSRTFRSFSSTSLSSMHSSQKAHKPDSVREVRFAQTSDHFDNS